MPILLERLVDRIDIRHEIEPIVNVPLSIVISGGLTLVALPGGANPSTTRRSRAPPAWDTTRWRWPFPLFLIGFFMMINRRKALTQVLALLTLENGVFLAAICLTYGMPLIVELGVLLRCAGGGHGAGHSGLPHPRVVRIHGRQQAAEAAGGMILADSAV